MTTKLETLKDKLARIQAQIAEEEAEANRQAAIAKVRDTFETAIRAAIADVETKEGFSLKDVSLGIWAGYAEGGLTVSFLQAGDDGLPKAIKKSSNGTGNGNGHATGATGNGDSEYVLADGRVFATCLDAVHAMGIETHGADGKVLSGKAYYHRHDRLPKEVKDAITKQAKATEEAAADGDATS